MHHAEYVPLRHRPMAVTLTRQRVYFALIALTMCATGVSLALITRHVPKHMTDNARPVS